MLTGTGFIGPLNSYVDQVCAILELIAYELSQLGRSAPAYIFLLSNKTSNNSSTQPHAAAIPANAPDAGVEDTASHHRRLAHVVPGVRPIENKHVHAADTSSATSRPPPWNPDLEISATTAAPTPHFDACSRIMTDMPENTMVLVTPLHDPGEPIRVIGPDLNRRVHIDPSVWIFMLLMVLLALDSLQSRLRRTCRRKKAPLLVENKPSTIPHYEELRLFLEHSRRSQITQTNTFNLPTVTQDGPAVVEDAPGAAEEPALVKGPPAASIEICPVVQDDPVLESPPAAVEEAPEIAIPDDLLPLVLAHTPNVLGDLSAILPGDDAISHLSDSSTFGSMSDCSTSTRFSPSRIPRLASLSSLRRATILDASTAFTIPATSTASAMRNRSTPSIAPTMLTVSTPSTPPSITRHTISSHAHMKFIPTIIPPSPSTLYDHMHIYSIPPLPRSPSPASPKRCIARLPSRRTSSTTIRAPRQFHDGRLGQMQRQD